MFMLIGVILLCVGSFCFFITLLIFDYESSIYEYESANRKKKLRVFIIIFLVLMFAGLTLICVSADNQQKMSSTAEVYEVVDTQELLNFKDAANTNGRFFLGTGSADGTTYYCYYTNTSNGYLLNKINASENKVYINYCKKDERPHIDRLRQYKVKTITNKNYWLWNIKAITKKHSVGTVVSKKETFTLDCYKAFLPDDSIVGTYEIDME